MRVEREKGEAVSNGETLGGGDGVEEDGEGVDVGGVEVCRAGVLGRHADDGGQDTSG